MFIRYSDVLLVNKRNLTYVIRSDKKLQTIYVCIYAMFTSCRSIRLIYLFDKNLIQTEICNFVPKSPYKCGDEIKIQKNAVCSDNTDD